MKKIKKLFSCPGKFLLWITEARDLLVVELLCCVVLYMLIKLASCKLVGDRTRAEVTNPCGVSLRAPGVQAM